MKGPQSRTDEYFIYSFLCNTRAKLKLQGIALMLQESAWLHAESCGAGYTHMEKEGLVWVLSGLKIRIHELPVWGEHLQLTTWGRGYESLFAFRDFEIFRKDREKAVIQASSAWLLIDMQSRRPVRITPDLQRIEPIHKTWTDTDPGKFNLPEDMDTVRELKVLYSDLDVYNHVNNTRYLEWCLDSIPEYHSGEMNIEDVDLRFVSEAHLDDVIRLEGRKSDEEYFMSGRNKESDREVFRIHLKFNSL